MSIFEQNETVTQHTARSDDTSWPATTAFMSFSDNSKSVGIADKKLCL